MTAFDRFDPFERRIATAIDEIAAARTPDYLEDIFQATARSSQRPAWTFPERWTRVNRLTLAAAGATLAVVVAIGALMNLLPSSGPGVTPSPPASPEGSPTPTPQVTPEAAGAPAEALWGDWLAEVEAIPGIEQPAGTIQLSVNWEDGLSVWIQQDVFDSRFVLKSTSLTPNAGELRLRSQPSVGCISGDEGRYAWTRSQDGLFLEVTLVEDDCAVRATTLARTWVRTLGAVNDGGHGVVGAVDPLTEVTLPFGQRLAADSGDGWQVVKTFGDLQPFQAFVVIRNPGGFGAPCSTTDKQSLSIPATTADFLAYVEGLPGANITSEATEIDGRPALQLDYRIDDGVACEAGEIFALHPEIPTDGMNWTSVPGELQRMYIVQMDAETTFLLWYQGNSETEGQVIDSVRFIDRLPTP